MKCEDCKGTGVYVGLVVKEECQSCKGSGKDRDYYDDYGDYLVGAYEDAEDDYRDRYFDPYGWY